MRIWRRKAETLLVKQRYSSKMRVSWKIQRIKHLIVATLFVNADVSPAKLLAKTGSDERQMFSQASLKSFRKLV